jgi:hypothetical protein
LFNKLNRIFEDVYRNAERDVRRNAVERLPLEMRMLARADALIALNIGYAMRSPDTWRTINKAIKRLDDEHQTRLGCALRNEEEIWDEMGSIFISMMNEFCRRKGLVPQIPDRTLLLPEELPDGTIISKNLAS